jgi:phage gp45-like
MFAQLVDRDAAHAVERGDAWTMHDGGEGVVVQLGDERQGGIILYYRAR